MNFSFSSLIYPILAFLFLSFPSALYGDEALFEGLAHTIDVKVNLSDGSIEGVDEICCVGGKDGPFIFYMHRDMDISAIYVSGVKVEAKERLTDAAKEISIILPDNLVAVRVEFKGRFPDLASSMKRLTRGVSYSGAGFVDPSGAFLSSQSLWYPSVSFAPALFDVSISVEKGFTAVMEGELSGEREERGAAVFHWKTKRPIDGANLVVGRYKITKERYKGIDIYTYFFKDDEALSKRYIDKTRDYIDIYEPLFPPYPFGKFAVVENLLPTGFGMPSYTLLGSQVLRLPFIPDVSLGHEFVHNWWGNGVFTDPARGNWAEALTTYTADHLYQELKGKGRDYRLRMLLNYRNYAGRDAISLGEFTHETSSAGRAVGYSKGAYFFHMLRNYVGEEKFYSGLEEFYNRKAFGYASPEDIEAVFEAVTDKPLASFFDQWFSRSDAPELSVEALDFGREVGGGYRVAFTVRQSSPPYALHLPVVFTMMEEVEEGEGEDLKLWREIYIEDETTRVEFLFSEPPLSFEVDPELDIFRMLSLEEVPPSLAALFGKGGAGRKGSSPQRKGAAIVLPSEERAASRYAPVAKELAKAYGLDLLTDSSEFKDEFGDRSLFIFGGHGENDLFAFWAANLPDGVNFSEDSVRIEGKGYALDKNVVVLCTKAASKSGQATVCLFLGNIVEKEMKRIAGRIPHLTSKSFLVFSSDGTVETGTFSGARPLRFRLRGWSALATLKE